MKLKSKEGTLQTIFKIVKIVTALTTNWSPVFLYLIYLSFTNTNVEFVWRQIGTIGGDTVQPVATNLAAPCLMKCVPKYSTLIPRNSNSYWWVRITSSNILFKRSYWGWPSKKFPWPVIIDGWAIMYHVSAIRGKTTGSKGFVYTCHRWSIFLIPSWYVFVFVKPNRDMLYFGPYTIICSHY